MTRALLFLGGYIAVWILFYLVRWRIYRGVPRLDVRQIRLSDPRRARAIATTAALVMVVDGVLIAVLIGTSVGLREEWYEPLVQIAFLGTGLSRLIAAFVGWRLGVQMVDVPRMRLIEVPPRSTASLLQVIFCAALTILPAVLLVLEF